MASAQPVLIIGSGICGLSLARTLKSFHIPVRVFEQAAETSSQGYGIALRSWAYQPLLDRLGLSSRDLKAAAATDCAVGGTGHIEMNLRDIYTGKSLSAGGFGPRKGGPAAPAGTAAGAATKKEEAPVFRCNRKRLRDYLRQGIPVEFNSRLEGIEKGPDNQITAKFSDGKSAQGSLVVGADGVSSAVRSLVFPEVQPSRLPVVAYSGVFTMPKADFQASLGPHIGRSNFLTGIGDGALLLIGVIDHRPAEVDLHWVYAAFAKEGKSPARSSEGKTPPEVLEELKRHGALAEPYATFFSPEAAKKTFSLSWDVRSIRIPRESLMNSCDSGVVLMGDAAHAMPPFGGEGACHAMVDGLRLGEALAESPGKMNDGVRLFYEREYDRWADGVDWSEKGAVKLIKPIKVWRGEATQ